VPEDLLGEPQVVPLFYQVQVQLLAQQVVVQLVHSEGDLVIQQKKLLKVLLTGLQGVKINVLKNEKGKYCQTHYSSYYSNNIFTY
jgi:hypothetical protein